MTKTPTRTPAKPRAARKPAARTAAAKPAEIVGQTLERALDPLRSAWKAAALKRADRSARQFSPAPAPPPGKPGLQRSPNAVPMPAMPPIAGVELSTGSRHVGGKSA